MAGQLCPLLAVVGDKSAILRAARKRGGKVQRVGVELREVGVLRSAMRAESHNNNKG